MLTQQGTSVNYFLADHLGSTNGLADASGAITSQTAYDSFGNAINSTFASRYQFTGREHDSFSGLHHYRARFYDSNLGRFASEDPIGFGGGEVNLYGYVWNNPLHYVDPMGLDGFGNDFADWADRKTEYARKWWQGKPENWVRNGGVNTVADLASGFNNMFRVGTGLGQAMYCENLSDIDRLDLVAADVVRGGSLFLSMAGPFAGRIGRAPAIKTPGLGDLTPSEISAIQAVADRAGRPIEVVGSAARGARRAGSDIDYIAPPSSIPYFKSMQHNLPGIDPTHGIIPGYGNPHIGPVIRFEPGGIPWQL